MVHGAGALTGSAGVTEGRAVAALREMYYKIGGFGLLLILVLGMRTHVLARFMNAILVPLGELWGHIMPDGVGPFGF